jgi:hypothetical protein
MQLRLILPAVHLLLFLASACLLKAQSEPIPILNKQQSQVLRDQIAAYFWGGEEAPVVRQIDPGPSLAEFLYFNTEVGTSNLSSLEAFEVEMKYGFKSRICLLHPARPNGKRIPVIYHAGHSGPPFQEDAWVHNGGAPYSRSFLNFFLSKGYDIITIGMPMTGGNAYPDSVVEGGRTYAITNHDDLFNLQKPYYYFLRPIKSILDYLENRGDYHEFIMVGFSGGGWATDVYSAIDTRIKKGFGVAGSIPGSLRLTWSNRGDKEQNYWDFYDRYNYTTLYFLAGEGKGRMHMQILNEHDNCCFAFNGTDLWVKDINQKYISNHQAGEYKFYFDPNSIWHCMSSVAQDTIYANISNEDDGTPQILADKVPDWMEVIRIYPNPATDFINIDISSGSVNEFYYTITSIQGVILQAGVHYDNYPINIQKLSRGSYIIAGQTKSGKKFQQKFWVK